MMMLATTACLIVRPSLINNALKPMIISMIGLSCLQLLDSGYSWRYVPGYGLLLLLTLWALAREKVTTSIVVRRLLQVALVMALPVALLPWSVFRPVPVLPQPMGPYHLGTKIFRWVDVNREEAATDDTHDRRNVIVQVWYPANAGATGEHTPYLDGVGMLPDNVGGIPSALFDRYDQVATHAVLNAPLSTAQTQWPVIIFLPGNAASRSFYTSLITHMASSGYIVLAIDHPYDALITQLADGSLVTNIERNIPGESNLLKFMALRAQTRIADVSFVLDELFKRATSDNFFAHFDRDRVVIAGHSLGGATGAMAMAVDPRIKAAVNVDGTPYGALPETSDPRPFLLIESKKDTSDRFRRYEEGNQKLFQHFGGGLRYELPHADHYSFTDAPLLLTTPARSLVSLFFGVGNVPDHTCRSTAAMITTFFSEALLGDSINLDSVAGDDEDVVKKNVRLEHMH